MYSCIKQTVFSPQKCTNSLKSLEISGNKNIAHLTFSFSHDSYVMREAVYRCALDRTIWREGQSPFSFSFFFEQAVTCHDESTSAHMCPFPPTSVSFCFSFSFIFHLPAQVLAVVVVDLHVHTKLSIRSLKALQLLVIPCPADQQLNFPHASPAVPNN